MSDSTKPPKAVSEYFSQMGKKGGKTKGATKRRGDSDHYRRIAAKRWAKEKGGE